MGNFKFFFIFLSFLIYIIFGLKKNNSFVHSLDTVIVSIDSDKEALAIKAFMDFDDMFDYVYVDSTDYFNLQNVLKLVDLNDFKFKEAYLSSNNFNTLFADFYENIQIDEYVENKIYISSFSCFISYIDYFLNSDIVSPNIGNDLLFSLLVDYNRNDTFDKSKIILNLKSEIDYQDLFEVFYKFNKKNFSINFLEFNNEDIYDFFISEEKHEFDLFLNKHYWAFSDDLIDLKKSVGLLTDKEVNSILIYVNNKTAIKGDRYKKIRNFSISNADYSKKKYLDIELSLKYLEDIKYFLLEKKISIAQYELNQIINKLIDNINKLNPVLKKQKTNIRYFYLQDSFYNSYNNLVKDFVSLSPITIDYINSSIKKKYYNFENNMYISKIFINDDNYKKKSYINEVFNNKTNLLK